MKQHTWRTLLLALGVVVALTACGGSGTGSEESEGATTSEAAAPAPGPVKVTGVEYEFQGLSGTVAAGSELRFTNGGKEAHELVLMRVKDSETRSLGKLLKLPEKQAQKVAKFQGVAIAGPGDKGRVVEGKLKLTKPGRYAAICFIPVGTKKMPKGPPEEGGKPSGPPHFTKGMAVEFTVQ